MEDDILRIVSDAARGGEKLKAVGTGHSWSPVTQSLDSAVSLREMSGLVGFDRAEKQVTVWAGTTLHELNKLLVRQGFALSCLGSLDLQTVAGAVSTATHGTGIRFGTLSGALRHVRLVDGRGRVHDLRPGDPRFEAACCSVGALGIVTQLTFQCEQAFNLHCVEELRNVEDVFDDLDSLVRNNDHFKLWWVPDTNKALTFRMNRTEERPRGVGLSHRWHRDVMRNTMFDLGLGWFSLAPGTLPIWNKLITRGTPKRREYVDVSHKVFSFPVQTKHWESEFALPIACARDAFNAMRDMIRRQNFRVGFITEVRFVKGEDIWLSPAYGRDSVYIGAFQYHALPHEDYFRHFTREMSRFEGRPHWGKLHDLTGREIAARYPRLEDFKRVREELDPEGVFLNRYVADFLGT
jgi:L-gulonolactone oxidase